MSDNLRMATNLQNLINTMNAGYDELTKLQGEALVGSPLPKHSRVVSVLGDEQVIKSEKIARCDMAAVKAKMNEITKVDVALNNLLVRSRHFAKFGIFPCAVFAELPAGT